MKKNINKRKIEELQKRIAPLQKSIHDIVEKEEEETQLPRCREMIGYCLRSTYEPESYYGKILDFVEYKGCSPQFIIEVVHITKEGNPYIHLDNHSPYLNKEWWDSEVPMRGWKKCSETEYLTFKGKVVEELKTQKSLRAFIKKSKY